MVKFNTNCRIKYTKENISDIAHDFMDLLTEKNLAQDVAVYFNGMRYSSHRVPVSKGGSVFYFYKDLGDSNDIVNMQKNPAEYDPNNYFDFVPEKHIMSVSFEGLLYDVLNGMTGQPYWMSEFFRRWGLHIELGNSWNFSLYPDDVDGNSIELWEYVDYSDKNARLIEEETIYLRSDVVHPDIPEIDLLMKYWYTLSKATGDLGGCVIGAKLTFDYKGNHYLMWPCSPWQGEGSWTPHVSEIVQILERLGAINVNWNCGYLD